MSCVLPGFCEVMARPFSPSKHIDERGLPHVGSTYKGILGEPCRRALVYPTIADDELCRGDDHRDYPLLYEAVLQDKDTALPTYSRRRDGNQRPTLGEATLLSPSPSYLTQALEVGYLGLLGRGRSSPRAPRAS